METRDFAIAINKFFYYAMNYGSREFEVNYHGNVETRVLPDFMSAKWNCSLAHMADKWDACSSRGDSYGHMMRFYAELDGSNRYELLKWIEENFHQREDYGITFPNE